MEEVKATVFEMQTWKSLGSDGFLVEFFKSFWDIIVENLTTSIEKAQTCGRILKAMNHTLLTIILMGVEVEGIANYKPIPLYKVVYKIITKVMANNLTKKLFHQNMEGSCKEDKF